MARKNPTPAGIEVLAQNAQALGSDLKRKLEQSIYGGTITGRIRSGPTEKEWRAQQDADRKAILAQIGARLYTLRDTFAVLIDQVAEDVYAAMQAQGFWSGDQDSTGQKLALIHSEVSEWLEADRKGIDADDKIPDYTGPEAEAADTIIRIFDLAARHDMRLGAAIIDKMLFNLTREPKHGKKY